MIHCLASPIKGLGCFGFYTSNPQIISRSGRALIGLDRFTKQGAARRWVTRVIDKALGISFAY